MFDLNSMIEPANRWFYQNRTNILRSLVVGGVLIAGAVLAPLAALGYPKSNLLLLLIFGMCLIIGTIFLFSHWPVLLIIIVILGGMFVKFAGPSGLNVSLLGMAFIFGLWLFDMMLREHNIKFVTSRTLPPLFCLMLISFLSFGFGQLPWFVYAQHAPMDAQLGGLAIVAVSVIAFLLVANLTKEIRWLQALTWTFIAFGAVYVTGRMLNWGEIDSIYHPGFSAGSMFWTWLAALTFSQVIINEKLSLRWRLLLVGILLITFYDAIIQAYDWKSGWVPPLTAVAAIVIFRYWRRILFLLPLGLIPAYYVATRAISSDQYSWATRLEAWSIVTEIAKANPLLGLGFANYYWYTPLFSIRGYSIRFNSHSQFVDLIAEIGILGLAAFLWFFWEVFRLGWWLRERVPVGFARAYVYGALGGLVGTLVAAALVDWVLPFVYNIGLTGFRSSVLAWLFLGGLVSLEQIVLREA